FVHVPGGDGGYLVDNPARPAQPGNPGGPARPRKTDSGRDVAERPVPHVLEQHRRQVAVDDEQVGVATVVEIGRYDGDGVGADLQTRVASDVGPRPVAVIAQQLKGRRREVA